MKKNTIKTMGFAINILAFTQILAISILGLIPQFDDITRMMIFPVFAYGLFATYLNFHG